MVERLRWGSQVAEVRHAQGWQYTQSRGQAGHLQGAARPPVCSPAAGVPVRRQQYPSQGQIRSGPCPVPCLHCDLYLWAQLASMNTCCLGIQGRALPSALRAWGHAKQAARLTPPHALVQPWDLSSCHLVPILPGPGDKANLPWKVRRSTGKTNTSAVPLSPCSQTSHLTFLLFKGE